MQSISTHRFEQTGACCLCEAMSHALTDGQTDVGSLLTEGGMPGCEHTANAATVRDRRSRNCRHGSKCKES